jgi:ferredoxin
VRNPNFTTDGKDTSVREVRWNEAAQTINPYDKAMPDNCFGIICGEFCGKCLHRCPSKKLSTKDLKDYDFSNRHRSINRSRL